MSTAGACPHVEDVREVDVTTDGCEACLRMGAEWVHERVCLSCGHVGCCDSSEHKHARRHFEATGHAIAAPRSDDEPWAWCFADAMALPGDWSRWWNAERRTAPARAPLSPILLVNFIGTLGFSLVLPFLVLLVTRWGGNALVYGLVGATYSAFQLVGAPILGRWSDRVGRRKILLLSQAGTLVSWIVFLVAFALPDRTLLRIDGTGGPLVFTLPLAVLFLARAFDGITGGNVSVANAYLADVSTAENRSANFGKMAVSANLGFVLGPAIAGLLGATAWGELAPVVAAALISLVAVVLIAVRLPESHRCILSRSPEHRNLRKLFGQEQADCFDMEAAAKLGAKRLFSLTGVPPLLAVYLVVMLAFNLFYVAFPVFAVTALAWTLPEIGVFFAVLGLLMAFVQGPVLSWASLRFGEMTLVLSGGAILAAGFSLFHTTSTITIYAAVTLMALGNGLMWPSVLSLLAEAAGDAYQGAVQGLAGSVGAGASIAGLIAGGFLFGTIGGKVFWAAAGLIALAVLLGWTGGRSTRDAAPPILGSPER